MSEARTDQKPFEGRLHPYYAAACQTAFACPRTRSEIAVRTDTMCKMIEQTIIGYEPFFDVRLFVFPEYAHGGPVYETVKEIREKIAVPVPNEHTEQYEQTAAKYGCYIQSGSFLEYDPDYPEAVFNTSVLIGPDGILAKYRKMNPWIPWEVHASPHDFSDYDAEYFPVVDTEIGRLGTAICYDWAFPETIRQIADNGAEIITRVSAYMDPWGAVPPTEWWSLFNRVRAIENMVYVVAANQGTSPEGLPPFSWPGSSMIADYDGRVLAQADSGPGEKITVAPLDVEFLRAERRRRLGHNMRAHSRTEAHDCFRNPVFPRGEHPINVEQLQDRIRAAQKKLNFRNGSGGDR